MNPRSTDYDADALTTTPSRRLEEQLVCYVSALALAMTDEARRVAEK